MAIEGGGGADPGGTRRHTVGSEQRIMVEKFHIHVQAMARPRVRWPLLLALLSAIFPTTLSLPGVATTIASAAAVSSNASVFFGVSAARFVAARGDEDANGEADADINNYPSASEEEHGAGVDEGDGGSDDDEGWWEGATEEDALLALALHGGEGGLWAGAFVPPPPRPDFLDERAAPDGLTTCDLCAWAWHGRAGGSGGFLDAAADHPGKIGWALTLAIVSILSAAIGAVIMVTVLQCRNRFKTVGSSGHQAQLPRLQATLRSESSTMKPPTTRT